MQVATEKEHGASKYNKESAQLIERSFAPFSFKRHRNGKNKTFKGD